MPPVIGLTYHLVKASLPFVRMPGNPKPPAGIKWLVDIVFILNKIN